MDIEDILQNRYRDTRICAECVEEPDLQTRIAEADGEPGCGFCGGEDAPTCDFLDLMDHIKTCIEGEYELAANSLPWESREGGWQFETVGDTYDLLTDELEIGFPRDSDGRLLEAMTDCLGGNQDWCVNDPFGEDPLDALNGGWDTFCRVIKHKTRFFLDRWKPPSTTSALGDRPTPAQMLAAIGDRITRLELYRTLPAGTSIYRVRRCKCGKRWRTPGDLGPPLDSKAVVSNRMSPPGIVMFYGALDPETAFVETVKKSGMYAIATFCTRRDARLLDLTKIPRPPRFFEEIPDSQTWGPVDAQFFHDLAADFTRPIERDDRVHVEYIPTQVFTEYCRLQFHHEHDTARLEGILYPSARNLGHTAVVLFADRSAVLGADPVPAGIVDNAWLELKEVVYCRHWLSICRTLKRKQ